MEDVASRTVRVLTRSFIHPNYSSFNWFLPPSNRHCCHACVWPRASYRAPHTTNDKAAIQKEKSSNTTNVDIMLRSSFLFLRHPKSPHAGAKAKAKHGSVIIVQDPSQATKANERPHQQQRNVENDDERNRFSVFRCIYSSSSLLFGIVRHRSASFVVVIRRHSFFVLRSSFFVLRSSFFVLRSPFFVLRSPSFVLRSSFFVTSFVVLRRPSSLFVSVRRHCR